MSQQKEVTRCLLQIYSNISKYDFTHSFLLRSKLFQLAQSLFQFFDLLKVSFPFQDLFCLVDFLTWLLAFLAS